MTQSNEVVRTLFTSFPVAELGSDEHRKVFEQLTKKFTQAADTETELKNLYKVKGFSDFAAVIMWILDKAQKDPRTAGISTQDETLLLSTFRRAMGEQGATGAPAPKPPFGSAGGDETGFASRLEKFAEVVQSGADGRGSMLERILDDCEHIAGQTADPDLKQFSTLMADFLKFIAEGELLDDVRVINIVSNIASSISQWVISPPEARHGLMEEALGMLRDFRTHFE
jgi:hypothetical protein